MTTGRTNGTHASSIVSIERGTGSGIVAVLYGGRRPLGSARLGDGTLAEIPDSDARREVPEHPPEVLALAVDGRPANLHHENLGLVASHLALSGVFQLPGGEIVAVYGAEVVPLG